MKSKSLRESIKVELNGIGLIKNLNLQVNGKSRLHSIVNQITLQQ